MEPDLRAELPPLCTTTEPNIVSDPRPSCGTACLLQCRDSSAGLMELLRQKRRAPRAGRKPFRPCTAAIGVFQAGALDQEVLRQPLQHGYSVVCTSVTYGTATIGVVSPFCLTELPPFLADRAIDLSMDVKTLQAKP